MPAEAPGASVPAGDRGGEREKHEHRRGRSHPRRGERRRECRAREREHVTRDPGHARERVPPRRRVPAERRRHGRRARRRRRAVVRLGRGRGRCAPLDHRRVRHGAGPHATGSRVTVWGIAGRRARRRRGRDPSRISSPPWLSDRSAAAVIRTTSRASAACQPSPVAGADRAGEVGELGRERLVGLDLRRDDVAGAVGEVVLAEGLRVLVDDAVVEDPHRLGAPSS